MAIVRKPRPSPSDASPHLETPRPSPRELGEKATYNAAGLVMETASRVATILRGRGVAVATQPWHRALETAGEVLAKGGTVADAVAAASRWLDRNAPPVAAPPPAEPPPAQTGSGQEKPASAGVYGGPASTSTEDDEAELRQRIALQREALRRHMEEFPF